MKNLIPLLVYISLITAACSNNREATVVTESGEDSTGSYTEPHRPQVHFSPAKNWMNDPNGLVYHNGEYHLFYQYYPEGDVWGPMHWGHAVTKDLVHWEHLPIALYPDSLGMIFSGSAVVDKQNTSGLGTTENPPMIAIFTYHNADQEKAGKNDYQTQGMAYSVDNGRTWTKYKNNPVIKNPGARDFRDPKVSWHEASKKWILTLVAGDHAQFYGSKDLITWDKLSEFGKDYGSHGGVWECPDLFPLTVEGESTQKWILIVNINPGGPNGGSGTQYFIGDFNGTKFTCDTDKSKTSWLDYGPDNYAGITWFDAPQGRTILIGWMSNWAYAQVVPTSPWRSASTIPRDLKLIRVNGKLLVSSTVIPELQTLAGEQKQLGAITVKDSLNLTPESNPLLSKSFVTGSIKTGDFVIELSNNKQQKLKIGYDATANRFFMDRMSSGKTDFSPEFTRDIVAPRLIKSNDINFQMVLDVSSVEVFFDDGATVMTGLYFPDEEFNQMKIFARGKPVMVNSFNVTPLTKVW